MRLTLAFALIGCTVPHEGLQPGSEVDGGADVERMDGCVVSAEMCNGGDDDCDGSIDEDASRACGTDVGDCSAGVERCVGGRFSGTCEGGTAPVDERCDLPGDEDCDGSANEMCGCSEAVACGTTEGICEQGTQACMDGMLQACVGGVRPATEVCNGLDDNCDGTADEGLLIDVYVDADGDGHGVGTAMRRCAAEPGFATVGDDCDDNPATGNRRFPGNPEACDGIDNDCSGGAEMMVTYYRDRDGDTFGDPSMSQVACDGRPAGFVTNNTDCDDRAGPGPLRYPGATEVCDGLDNDCDGDLDENDCAGCVRRVRASDGHVYQFCSTVREWDAARSACVEMGYDLVVIDTRDEDEWLQSQIISGDAWIGLTDRGTEGMPVWVTGGSPYEGAAITATGTPEDCFVLNGDHWSDRDCDPPNSVGHAYICEVSPR